MKKLSFLKNITSSRKKMESKEADIKNEYQVGKYKMLIRGNHMIEAYQLQFPLYDRFLPYFGSFFKGLIIDIGANVGDTALAIFNQNDDCFIIGAEPDSDFYEDCVANIQHNGLTDRFVGVNKFISTKKGSFIIEKDGTSSTGSINKNTSIEIEENAISFEGLLDMVPSDKLNQFDLLKVDTDGFDWDVLNSLADTKDLINRKPRFIFFEMQTFLNNDASKSFERKEMSEKYSDSLKRLQDAGFTHFSLFDNFGTFVMTTNSLDKIVTLNEYIIRSQVYNKYSTIFYFDVLAFSSSDLDFVNDKISNFYKKV